MKNIKWIVALTSFVSVVITAVIIITTICFYKIFDYQAIKIINLPAESGISIFNDEEILLLSKMNECGILMTPSEYMNHLANYYNFLIAFISIVFVVGSWFRIQYTKTEIEQWAVKGVFDNINSVVDKIKSELEMDYTINPEYLDSLSKRIGEIESQINVVRLGKTGKQDYGDE